MKIDPAPLKKVVLVLGCLLLVQILTNLFGKTFWLNLTESEPVGLYRLGQFDRPIKAGDMVIMAIPGQFEPYVYGRNWLPVGWLLLKHVGAVPGDTVCFRDSSFLINGVPIGPVYRVDSEGLPLPRLEGCRQVPDGHFFPIATGVKTSFDGRYMGPVSISVIQGLARPVWVF
jgi:conjugative transfer signal peptidase TraF